MKRNPVLHLARSRILHQSTSTRRSLGRDGRHLELQSTVGSLNGNACDYSRTFLQFTTDHSRHTPRMQIDASCTLTTANGVAVNFFLTAPCMSEHMYQSADLIQEPTSLFWMIAGDND